MENLETDPEYKKYHSIILRLMSEGYTFAEALHSLENSDGEPYKFEIEAIRDSFLSEYFGEFTVSPKTLK